MGEPFHDYLVAVDGNRDAFRRQHPAVYRGFDIARQSFEWLAKQLTYHRPGSPPTQSILAPLLFIFQRQSMAAFAAVTANQSFIGWSNVRPGIEAALMMGKWLDDPSHFETWSNHEKDWRAYAAVFQGKALRSTSLPRSAEIQGALRRINDLYLHPNPKYLWRHISLEDHPDGALVLSLDFFDTTIDAHVGILSLLHLVVVTQDAISDMFERELGCPPVDVGLASLEEGAGDWVRSLANEGPGPLTELKDLGLWSGLPTT